MARRTAAAIRQSIQAGRRLRNRSNPRSRTHARTATRPTAPTSRQPARSERSRAAARTRRDDKPPPAAAAERLRQFAAPPPTPRASPAVGSSHCERDRMAQRRQSARAHRHRRTVFRRGLSCEIRGRPQPLPGRAALHCSSRRRVCFADHRLAIAGEARRSMRELLQGGGIAGLYLTVFAATKLFHLLPLGLAFGLMVVSRWRRPFSRSARTRCHSQSLARPAASSRPFSCPPAAAITSRCSPITRCSISACSRSRGSVPGEC